MDNKLLAVYGGRPGEVTLLRLADLAIAAMNAHATKVRQLNFDDSGTLGSVAPDGTLRLARIANLDFVPTNGDLPAWLGGLGGLGEFGNTVAEANASR